MHARAPELLVGGKLRADGDRPGRRSRRNYPERDKVLRLEPVEPVGGLFLIPASIATTQRPNAVAVSPCIGTGGEISSTWWRQSAERYAKP